MVKYMLNKVIVAFLLTCCIGMKIPNMLFAGIATDADLRGNSNMVAHTLSLRKAMRTVYNNYQEKEKYSLWTGIDFRKAHSWTEGCDMGFSHPLMFKQIVENGVHKYLLVVYTEPSWGGFGFATDTIISAFVFNYSDSGWAIENSRRYAGVCGRYGDCYGTAKTINVNGRYTRFVITEESWRHGVHTINDGVYMILHDGIMNVCDVNVLVDPKDMCEMSSVVDSAKCRIIFSSKYYFVEGGEELPRLVVTEKGGRYVFEENQLFLRKARSQKVYIYMDGKYNLLN